MELGDVELIASNGRIAVRCIECLLNIKTYETGDPTLEDVVDDMENEDHECEG